MSPIYLFLLSLPLSPHLCPPFFSLFLPLPPLFLLSPLPFLLFFSLSFPLYHSSCFLSLNTSAPYLLQNEIKGKQSQLKELMDKEKHWPASSSSQSSPKHMLLASDLPKWAEALSSFDGARHTFPFNKQLNQVGHTIGSSTGWSHNGQLYQVGHTMGNLLV